MRAGVALHEDAVEYRVFRIVDPVLVGKVFAADADVDAAHRNVAQALRGGADFRGRLLPDLADQDRQRHGADELVVPQFCSVAAA